jgi:hypothetical protein
MKVKISIKIHQQLLDPYDEDNVNVSLVCWRIKNQERMGTFGPKSPAAVWTACHHKTQFEQAKIQ